MVTPSLIMVVLLAAVTPDASAFSNLFSDGFTHPKITQQAILHKTAEVLSSLAQNQGKVFSLAPKDAENLTPGEVLCEFYGEKVSASAYERAILTIVFSNVAVDTWGIFSSQRHFDDETFSQGRALIVNGALSVKNKIKAENMISAQLTLGTILHTLQDFYSHSNWVELGYKSPNHFLIQQSEPLSNLAGEKDATCNDCDTGTCMDNILQDILTQRKVTSGYFSLSPFSTKPRGKCSHGGTFDFTSRSSPKGGINKDSETSNHGHLHKDAGDLAVAASVELLEDIRNAVGDDLFLRFLNLQSPSALSFVIDTTGSMSNDIEGAKNRAFSIIDSKRGTPDEPSTYILVPFNDPDFGPVLKTSDPEMFKQKISALTASGGGDIPEMCLSGLQLALISTPPSSNIYVFTDAPPKDSYLRSTVLALMESTKSSVSFLLTGGLSRRRRGLQDQAQRSARMSASELTIYEDLALSSGGHAIRTTKSLLVNASVIIEDSSTSALVTVFQDRSDPARTQQSFNFPVDSSLRNLTIYISGGATAFHIISPHGTTQDSSVAQGLLGRVEHIGNLWAVYLEQEPGQWEFNISSTQSYTIKVTGQSVISFLYDFVTPFGGAHPGYTTIEGRPLAGNNGTMLVTVTGMGASRSLSVMGVTLRGLSGTTVTNGSVTPMGELGQYLVFLSEVPGGQFSILVKGLLNGSQVYQRQSSTMLTASDIVVRTDLNISLEPGKDYIIPFSMETNGTGGTFSISVRDDKRFVINFTESVTAGSNGTARGTFALSVPATVASGTDLTITVEAQSTSNSDFNYAVLRLAIDKKVDDFVPPACQVTHVSENCSFPCGLEEWSLQAEIRDNRSAVVRVFTHLGNGTLNTTQESGGASGNVTLVSYSASCCAPEVEILAVDSVGNVGVCSHSIRSVPSSTSAPSAAPLCSIVSLLLCCLLGLPSPL
ncbi:VWA7 protein, partial [Amia calva]|nr:VWA7 protein [Amia calva]